MKDHTLKKSLINKWTGLNNWTKLIIGTVIFIVAILIANSLSIYTSIYLGSSYFINFLFYFFLILASYISFILYLVTTRAKPSAGILDKFVFRSVFVVALILMTVSLVLRFFS